MIPSVYWAKPRSAIVCLAARPVPEHVRLHSRFQPYELRRPWYKPEHIILCLNGPEQEVCWESPRSEETITVRLFIFTRAGRGWLLCRRFPEVITFPSGWTLVARFQRPTEDLGIGPLGPSPSDRSTIRVH